MSTLTRAAKRSLVLAAVVFTLGSAYAACGTGYCDSLPIVIPPAPPSIVLPPRPVSDTASVSVAAPAPVRAPVQVQASVPAPVVSVPVRNPALVSTAVCNIGSSCSTCNDPRVMPTTLPGFYANDNSYAASVRPNAYGIPYLIPTANRGLLESPTVPITNQVDMFYATHNVVNGRVVRTAPNPPNLAHAAVFPNRIAPPNMTTAYVPAVLPGFGFTQTSAVITPNR